MRQLIRSSKQNKSLFFSTPHYSFSRLDKFFFILRRFLNKMSNEDTRDFKSNMPEQEKVKGPLEISTKTPQSMKQAQNLFLESQQTISVLQKSRMQRIDDILGTKTYFYDIKKYQQRVSVDNVMKISYLTDKYEEETNPQMGLFENRFKKRKYTKWKKNLKIYPHGNPEITQFSDSVKETQTEADKNNELIKFLGEEALYTYFALSELELTIKSILEQKVVHQQKEIVKQLYDSQLYFYSRNKTYFKPNASDSLYRINNDKFDKKLIHSISALSEALQEQTGQIEEVVSLEQIYECLTVYYDDKRVSQLLKVIENQSNLDELFTNIIISPDGKSMMLILDLLDNGKEFIGMYKKIQQNHRISQENVIFNFLPDVSFRNNGQLYYIQRSEEGIYTELCKTIFSNVPKTKRKEKAKSTDSQNIVAEHKEEKSVISQREHRILYKCKPYKQLKIVENCRGRYLKGEGEVVESMNIVVEQKQIGKATNNQLFLVKYEPGLSEQSQGTHRIQQLTVNNSRVSNLYKKFKQANPSLNIPEQIIDPSKIYTQCKEILGVGYALTRYYVVGKQVGDILKFGENQAYAQVVTLMPFRGYRMHVADENDQGIERLEQKQNEKLLSTKQGSGLINQNQSQNSQIGNSPSTNILPGLYSGSISLPQLSTSLSPQYFGLEPESESVLYFSPENQYIVDMQVCHTNSSNIYLLLNLSVQSVYNRNSLYVHPLRSGVNPYTIMLDGYPIKVKDSLNVGLTGKLGLILYSPIMFVPLQYTLWKKQIVQDINQRVYSETITIRQSQQGNLRIKILCSSKYAKRKLTKLYESQPIILHIPSKSEKILQLHINQLLQKGVIFVEIIESRGMFGSTMIELLRGTQKFYENYVSDIFQVIKYLKLNVGERIGIYAQGYVSCYAMLLLNIFQNQHNQLFDATVLFEGLYDTSQIPKQAEYFFGNGEKFINPYKLQIYNPTKSSQQSSSQQSAEQSSQQSAEQPEQVEKDPSSDLMMINLSNIVFSSLDKNKRAESRKFVHKLRNHRTIIYQTVYLKQFDKYDERDIYNLSYLYKITMDKLKKEYDEVRSQKAKVMEEENQAISRDNQEYLFKKDKLKNNQKQNS